MFSAGATAYLHLFAESDSSTVESYSHIVSGHARFLCDFGAFRTFHINSLYALAEPVQISGAAFRVRCICLVRLLSGL